MIKNDTHPNVETMNTVISQDGSKISYCSMGTGPAVIVIPGAFSTAADYATFAHALAAHFTVHIIERRGRGWSSPQGDDYSIDKECEDVFALQQQTGAALLVGHSFGGLVALEFARRNKRLARLAVYEPGVSINGSVSIGWIPAYKQYLAKQKYLDAFVEFAKGAGPDHARNTPHWFMKLMLSLFMSSHEREQKLKLLHESLREHQEVARLDSSYENYKEIPASVLLMYGGKSNSKAVTMTMERLAAVLPQSETKEFPKLDHFGINEKAPEEVAQAVSDFLLK